MKKKIFLIIFNLICVSVCITGCGKKSYNDVGVNDRSTSTDSRQLENGKLPSNFELISCEDVDKHLRLYIVKDEQNNKEYIIGVQNGGSVAITPRINNDNLNK